MKSTLLFLKTLSVQKFFWISLMSIFAVIIETKTMLLGLSMLIIFDLLMGIRKSLHKKSVAINLKNPMFWNSLTSSQLRRTWRKSYEYGIGILVCAIFQSLIFNMSSVTIMSVQLSITEGAIVVASVVEMYSIAENLRAVSGNSWIENTRKVMNAARSSNNNKDDYYESID